MATAASATRFPLPATLPPRFSAYRIPALRLGSTGRLTVRASVSVARHVPNRHRPRGPLRGRKGQPPQDRLPREGRAPPQGGVLLREHPRGAKDREDSGELRDGRCGAEFEGVGGGNERLGADHRAEAGEDQGEEVHCKLQAEGGRHRRHCRHPPW
ncbi:unnamed protein product [Musa acuminata subsp. burmannicoides]